MRIWVGTYSRCGGKGIAEIELEGDHLILKNWESSQSDPSYLAADFDSGRLYAACEFPVCQAACWKIGEPLAYLGAQPTGGKDTCHICLSPDRRFVYTASYADGVLSVFPVTENGLGACIQRIQNEGRGENPERQEGTHAHCVAFTPDGEYLCLCDLGIDAIILYRQDRGTGLLNEYSRLCFRGGLGVRHIAFADDHTAFAVHELTSSLSKLRYESGRMERIDTWDILDTEWKGKSFSAAVRVLDDRVYTSNRGKDTVSVFDFEGRHLKEIGAYGHWTRDIMPLRHGRVLCANQESGTVTLVDLNNGALLDSLSVPGAVAIITE